MPTKYALCTTFHTQFDYVGNQQSHYRPTTQPTRFCYTQNEMIRRTSIRPLNDRIHRTTLLTIPTINTLRHVNVISRRPPASILALLGFDRDCLCGTHGFAQLAGDAAFFAGRVAAEGMLASETGTDWALFEGVVDCVSV